MNAEEFGVEPCRHIPSSRGGPLTYSQWLAVLHFEAPEITLEIPTAHRRRTNLVCSSANSRGGMSEDFRVVDEESSIVGIEL